VLVEEKQLRQRVVDGVGPVAARRDRRRDGDPAGEENVGSVM
jgi:hypothetical protein